MEDCSVIFLKLEFLWMNNTIENQYEGYITLSLNGFDMRKGNNVHWSVRLMWCVILQRPCVAACVSFLPFFNVCLEQASYVVCKTHITACLYI